MMRVGDKGPELLTRTRYDIVRWTRGKGLDIGVGEYKAFPHFIGVREKSDDTIKLPAAADFLVDSFATMADFVDGELDFVFNWTGRVLGAQASRLLKVGGLYITADPHIKVHKKLADGEWSWDVPGVGPRPPKSALVIRYGAIGDSLQTAALLPYLKQQGYHVTMNCQPDGELVLRHDPNIDEFFVQDREQVPNGELLPYWAYLYAHYDHVVNLCECIEGTLLLFPGRANHRWPHSVRKKECNRNYLEFMAEIAEQPFHPEHHFYETFAETMKASAYMDRIGKQCNPDFVIGQAKWNEPFVIMWALAGSSVHKVYPHQDAVIAKIMTDIPNAHVVLVGNALSHILEAGWEKEPRVHCESGVMELRDVLTLANRCQLVIGPETGVLNSVAFEDNAKIVLLSHSTAENLTRDWINTESCASTVTPCYPCHRLHYTHEFCPKDEETSTAMCQKDLSPAVVWEAVQKAYIGWGTVRQLLQP